MGWYTDWCSDGGNEIGKFLPDERNLLPLGEYYIMTVYDMLQVDGHLSLP